MIRVFLIHAFAQPWWTLLPLRWYLRRKGYVCEILPYRWWLPVKKSALEIIHNPLLSSYEDGYGDVIFVGISLGGLVACEVSNIIYGARVITVCSPLEGSYLARLGVLLRLHLLVPSIKCLARPPKSPMPTFTTAYNLFWDFDGIVTPPQFHGIPHHTLGRGCHFSSIFDPWFPSKLEAILRLIPHPQTPKHTRVDTDYVAIDI